MWSIISVYSYDTTPYGIISLDYYSKISREVKVSMHSVVISFSVFLEAHQQSCSPPPAVLGKLMENIDLFGRGDVRKHAGVHSTLCHRWLSDGITVPSLQFPCDCKLLSYLILDNKMVLYTWSGNAKVKLRDKTQKQHLAFYNCTLLPPVDTAVLVTVGTLLCAYPHWLCVSHHIQSQKKKKKENQP